MTFLQSQQHKKTVTASNESDTSSVTLQSSHESLTTSPHLHASAVNSEPGPSVAANPWLQAASGSGMKLSRRKAEALVSKSSSAATKSKAAFKKQLDRSEDAQIRDADDAVVEISLDNVMTMAPPAAPTPSNTKKGKKGKGKETSKVVVDPAYRHEDDEGDEGLEDPGKGVKAFEQRELVALAFAGDNVVEVCRFFSVNVICTTHTHLTLS